MGTPAAVLLQGNLNSSLPPRDGAAPPPGCSTAALASSAIQLRSQSPAQLDKVGGGLSKTPKIFRKASCAMQCLCHPLQCPFNYCHTAEQIDSFLSSVELH